MPGLSPRPRPTHRHGRRVQREAFVVVVTGPVQRVLELRPRTTLGLADPLLALVVHPPGVTSCSRDDLGAPRFLLPTHPSPARTAAAAAAPKRPSPWPGAFKVAFQKIHSPTTSRASGWARGCRLPRPPASRGEPLARAPPGSALTLAGSPPCWEGRADRGAASLRPRPSCARFRCARHFRAWVPYPAARFRRASRRGHLFSVSLLPGVRRLLTSRPRRRPLERCLPRLCSRVKATQ